VISGDRLGEVRMVEGMAWGETTRPGVGISAASDLSQRRSRDPWQGNVAKRAFDPYHLRLDGVAGPEYGTGLAGVLLVI